MFCTKCGTELPPQTVFCPYCGTAVNIDQNCENANPTMQIELQPPNPPVRAKQQKKLTHKWWFWAIIVVVAILIINLATSSPTDDASDAPASTDSEQSSDESTEPTSEIGSSDENWYLNGTYKVGSDIPAGEYAVEATRSNCYIEVSSDSSGTFDSILANDNISTHRYITVDEGQYLTIRGGRFSPIDEVGLYQADDDGSFGEGMYKAGRDIPAGEYKLYVIADSYGYVEVDSDSYGTFDSIVANENLESGSFGYITVAEGQYLLVHGITFTPAE